MNFYLIMPRKILLISITLIFAASFFKFLFPSCLDLSPVNKSPFMLRVRIAHAKSEFKFRANSSYKIYNANTGELLGENLMRAKDILILLFEHSVKFGDKVFSAQRIRIVPLSGFFILNGITYRGDIDIVRIDNVLDAVNRVDIEDYLKGVLPREVSYLWPFEAIKAQGIVSRTFAVHEALRYKKRGYDLRADVFSQVYGGSSSERWRTNRAVEATRGKVLEYKGRILPSYFHSRCGGHTKNVSDVWGGKTIAPLKGVKCSWCKWRSYFRWKQRYRWGHGVGMCQWGAFGQALMRRSAEKILEYYYPGARIVELKVGTGVL